MIANIKIAPTITNIDPEITGMKVEIAIKKPPITHNLLENR